MSVPPTIDRDLAARLYWKPNKRHPTLASVGAELGVHASTIHRALIALGVPRRPWGGNRRVAYPACPVCGRARAMRLRPERGGRAEKYCRFCQARSGKRWRARHPDKVASYRRSS